MGNNIHMPMVFDNELDKEKSIDYLNRFHHTRVAKGLLMCCYYARKYNLADGGWISPAKLVDHTIHHCEHNEGGEYSDDSLLRSWGLQRERSRKTFFSFHTKWLMDENLNELEAEITNRIDREIYRNDKPTLRELLQ